MNCDFSYLHYSLSAFRCVITRTLASLMLFLVVNVASAGNPDAIFVNVFGDGNPENGIEDNRQQIMGGRDSATGLSDQRLNGGTIKCDGKIRGSAMVIDTREIAPALNGVILASAAHVLYDLEKNRLFKRCQFHFLALDQLSSYKAKIDLKRMRKGGFDPTGDFNGSEFGEGDWVFLYIPKPWKSFRPNDSLTLADFSFKQTESYLQSGGEIRLIAYDSKTRVMSSSSECTVMESHTDDLGGGTWKGQLMDDCDSTGGASGGGIVAVVNHQHYLIGIRSGSHWSEDMYPLSSFPMGPPEGSPWSRQLNTNFGRAIDAKIMQQLVDFVYQVNKYEDTL
jgi:hypothetical protein